MTNRLLLLFVFLFSINIIYAQDTEALKKKEEVAKKRLNKVFQDEFSRVVTGSALGIPGNYASISTDNKSLSASMFFVLEPKRILSVAIAGGAVGNITEVFDEGKLNSDVSINASYHFLLKTRNQYKSIDKIDDRLYENKIEALEQKFERETIKLRNKQYINDAKAKLKTLNATIKKDSMSLNTFNLKLLTATLAKDKTEAQDSIAAVTYRLELNNFDREIARNNANTNMAGIARTITNKEYEKNKAKKKVTTEWNKQRAKGVNMTWATFGYGANNKSFKLFDSEAELASQLVSEDYTTQTVTLSINRLKTADLIWKDQSKTVLKDIKPHGTEYTSLGVNFKYTDNLSSLTKTEIVDTSTISEDPQRDTVKRQNAFAGDYITDLSQLTTFLDYYNYFGPENSFALHLNPEYKIRENMKPVAQFKLGILVPFKKADGSGSTSNLEIFYKLTDIFNTTDNENALLNRNVIGLQASFPFALRN